MPFLRIIIIIIHGPCESLHNGNDKMDEQMSLFVDCVFFFRLSILRLRTTHFIQHTLSISVLILLSLLAYLYPSHFKPSFFA